MYKCRLKKLASELCFKWTASLFLNPSPLQAHVLRMSFLKHVLSFCIIISPFFFFLRTQKHHGTLKILNNNENASYLMAVYSNYPAGLPLTKTVMNIVLFCFYKKGRKRALLFIIWESLEYWWYLILSENILKKSI